MGALSKQSKKANTNAEPLSISQAKAIKKLIAQTPHMKVLQYVLHVVYSVFNFLLQFTDTTHRLQSKYLGTRAITPITGRYRTYQ